MKFRFSRQVILAFAFAFSAAAAETPAMLAGAIRNWSAEMDEWAFTQRVRTFDDEKIKLERLERYDPSRPDNQRWELLKIDGKPPTAGQREYWQQRKNRKPKRRSEKAIEDYFDFERATMVEETPEWVRYDVPINREMTRLVPLEKISVEVTVNKRTQTIQQVTGGLREPFRFALGLAKITDIWLDVRFDPILHDLETDPDATQAIGAAHVVLFKMGDRAEYAWSDFKRVTPVQTSKTPRSKNASGS